jgi:hypothetical protein
MGDRKLSFDEVNALINKPKRESVNIKAVTAADEIYRSHAKELQDLFDGKAKTIMMAGYKMKVVKRINHPTDKDEDMIFVQVTEGFVPCGWITRKWLSDQLELEKGV